MNRRGYGPFGDMVETATVGGQAKRSLHPFDENGWGAQGYNQMVAALGSGRPMHLGHKAMVVAI